MGKKPVLISIKTLCCAGELSRKGIQVTIFEGLHKTRGVLRYVNPETMESSIKGVYAGGNIVGGESTVIEAMGMGKKASYAILKYLEPMDKKISN